MKEILGWLRQAVNPTTFHYCRNFLERIKCKIKHLLSDGSIGHLVEDEEILVPKLYTFVQCKAKLLIFHLLGGRRFSLAMNYNIQYNG